MGNNGTSGNRPTSQGSTGCSFNPWKFTNETYKVPYSTNGNLVKMNNNGQMWQTVTVALGSNGTYCSYADL